MTPTTQEPSVDLDRTRFADQLLEPVHSVNVFEETLERILRLIKLGLVLPGDKLPAERELARRLEVSRPTVREAIRSLAQAGYLETRLGRSGGAYVLESAGSDSDERARAVAQKMGDTLLDALDFRSVVEPGVAGLAAQRATAHDRARLDDALSVLAAAPRVSFPATERPVSELDRPLSYRFADRRLHLVIADIARAPSLAEAVTQVQVRLADLLLHTPQIEEALRHSDEQHAAVVGAIKAGDPVAARDAMELHVAATNSFLRGFIA